MTDQDFPGEAPPRPPPRGTATYYLTKFLRKLHENEEILARGCPLCKLLRPATGHVTLDVFKTRVGHFLSLVCSFLEGYLRRFDYLNECTRNKIRTVVFR